MINFTSNLYQDEYSFKETKELREKPRSRGDIQTSSEISGMEVRLSNVFIKDNKTPRLGPFPGLAKVYLLNIAVSDIQNSTIELALEGFEKVDDKQNLGIDRTLFYWKKEHAKSKSPSQIHLMTSLIKSKKALREVGSVLTSVKDDADFKSIASTVGTIVKSATPVSVISEVVFKAASIVGKFLGNVDDKPLLTRFQIFTDIAGSFNQIGKTVFPFGNMYADVDYSVYIRDRERQDEEIKK